eukprot:522829_1
MTIITLTQILTTNNWHIIMYTAIQVTDNWFNSLYFITFFFFGPILVVTYLLAMFFNIFFVSAAESETDLSDFFHETDQSAKELQHHMELQEIRQQQLYEEQYEEYPKEIGMHQLLNGQTIITVRRPILNTNNNDINDDPDNDEPQPLEQEEIETELVHIPLHNVCRQLWDNVPGEDFAPDIDSPSNNIFKNTFNGRDATNYLLSAGFAPDAEDAVDYLAVIMDDINPFMRVDIGKQQEFENNENAHYQWIIVPDDDDELNENDQVALEDITIGYRHSYGGYHRLLKEYRQAGIDPSQAAAQRTAAQFKQHTNVNSTPISNQNTSPIVVTDVSSPNGADNSTSDLVKNVTTEIKHLRNKSQKLLEDVTSTIKLKINNNNDTNDNNNDMAESDDEEKQVVPEFKSDDNNNTKILYSTSVTNLNKNKNNNTNSVELTSFTPTTNMNKAQSHGLQLHEINRAKTMPANKDNNNIDNDNNNEEEDTIAPLGKFGAPPGLQKSKSVKGMNKPGGLNRSLSSKMILLRHLDDRGQKSHK